MGEAKRRGNFSERKVESLTQNLASGIGRSKHSVRICRCEQVQSLQLLVEGINKGMSGVGLRREMKPETLLRVVQVLNHGSAAEISHLMRDVAGESISLAAGSSSSGPAALKALSDAQAQCAIALRSELPAADAYTAEWKRAADLLEAHQACLMAWVASGKAESDSPEAGPSDLTMIGMEFLETPDTRRAAISSFVAGTAVMASALNLFVE
jgi:hypothetical protein